jgi:hypothetical protein
MVKFEIVFKEKAGTFGLATFTKNKMANIERRMRKDGRQEQGRKDGFGLRRME